MADNNAADTTEDIGNKSILTLELEALPSWGPSKLAVEVGTGNSTKWVSERLKRGRSATKQKKARSSYKSKHSKSKRRCRSTSSSSSTEQFSLSPKKHKSRRKKCKHLKHSSLSFSSSPSSSSEFWETDLKEAYLKQQILTQNPVPHNLDQVWNWMTLFVISWKISANKKIWTCISYFRKFNWRIPVKWTLSQSLWMLVDEARRSKEKQITIDLDNIRAYIEKTVLLLGQTSNYITYFRRYNILAAPNCPA